MYFDIVEAVAAADHVVAITWSDGVSGVVDFLPIIDRGGWFTLDQARTRIFKGQDKFLDRLAKSFENGIDGERLTRREK